MTKIKLLLTVVLMLLVCGTFTAPASADISLFDWAFNINDAVSEASWGDPFPTEADVSLFNDVTGLGTIAVTVTGPGAHDVRLFVDHELSEATTTFFTNEYGATSGTPAAGVYDISGRFVKNLSIARVPNSANTFEATWDGRNANGRATAPGVYFVRITTYDKATTARVTIAR